MHDALKSARAPRPRIAVIEWTDPIFVAGHWVPDMVKRAGGTDVMAAAGAHSVVVDVAAVERADPEIVIVAPCGYDVARAAGEAVRARPASEVGMARGSPALGDGWQQIYKSSRPVDRRWH